MHHRCSLNQVKFQVRYNALLLRKFRVYELVELTGLNESSIRSELDRMKKEGFITSSPEETSPRDVSEKHRKGRESKVVYKLSEDPKVRYELAQSIEAFASAGSISQPTSHSYYSARERIREAIEKPDERENLLAKAEKDLITAMKNEGGKLAPESVRSRLNYELARVAFWRGKGQETENFFKMLRKTFVDLKDQAMVESIDGFLLCIKGKLYPSNDLPLKRATDLLRTITENHYWTENPLTTVSIQINQQLVDHCKDPVPVEPVSPPSQIRPELISLEALLNQLAEFWNKSTLGFGGIAAPRSQTCRTSISLEESPSHTKEINLNMKSYAGIGKNRNYG